jgi:hypothetical protein
MGKRVSNIVQRRRAGERISWSNSGPEQPGIAGRRAPTAQLRVEQLSGIIGRRAPTARNRVARGERVARCPWIPYKQNLRPGGPAENVRRAILSPHPGLGRFSLRIQGRRAPPAGIRVAWVALVVRGAWIPYKQNLRPGGPAEHVRRAFLSPHPGLGRFSLRIQGRRAPLRFALAPGYLIPRLRRSAPIARRRRSMPRYSAPAALSAP